MKDKNEILELSDNRRELRKFARRTETIIRDEIRKQGLIQTGNMLRSIKCKASIGSMGQLDMKVDAIDYFKYIDGDFKVLDTAFSSLAYQTVLLDYQKFKNRFNK